MAIHARVQSFPNQTGIQIPILMAPMAGACAPSLSAAVANAGGLGGCGALLMTPGEIETWCADFRRQSQGKFQINLWTPDPPPVRDLGGEERVREFLAKWGQAVPAEAGDAKLPDFAAQCETLLAVKPRVISSIMGLYPAAFVSEMKRRGIFGLRRQRLLRKQGQRWKQAQTR